MSSGSISSKINTTINSYSPGSILTYSSFNIPKEKELALAKSLSRLEKKGEIVRLEKGKYYKPRKTTFGNLRPEVNQIIKAETQKGNKLTGYPTGVTIYNQMGLTSQMANVIVIASINPKPEKEISGYRLKFVKRDFEEIEETDIPLLQLLDAIKDIKRIPDASPDEALKVIIFKIKEMPVTKLKQLAKLALKYNAATKALTGALLEKYSSGINISPLFKSLNSLSKYEIEISLSLLPNQTKWNIE